MRRFVLSVFSIHLCFICVAQDINPFVSTEFTQITRIEFDTRVATADEKAKLFCEDWCVGQVTTRLDTLDVKFNYDLSDDFFYINMNDKVFTLKSDFIIGFLLNEQSYICYDGYQDDQLMILEVVAQGNYTLYTHHGLKYNPPDFDPILNIGNKEASYKRTSDYYTFCHDRLHKISSKPKKALKLLQQECDVDKNVKVRGDLEKLFRQLNERESDR